MRADISMKVPTARLTRNGQVTLPKQVREALGANEGDFIAFVEERGRIWIAVADLTVRVRVGRDAEKAK